MSDWVKHRVNKEREFSVRKSEIIATEKKTTYTTMLEKQFTVLLYLKNTGQIVVGEKLTEDVADNLIAEIEAEMAPA